jgi:hypothetical protein
MDVEGMISRLKDLDREELVRLDDAVKRRLREIGGGGTPVSDVLEYRPHADGYLQHEVRRYLRKDGSVKEHGPYWYFRYHEGGRQRTLYLGRTDDPKEELERKRAESQNAT